MKEKNISQEFRLKNKVETKNYFLEEIEPNELINRKQKKSLHNSKLYWKLSYFSCYDYWMYFNFFFASFFGISIGITSSAVG